MGMIGTLGGVVFKVSERSVQTFNNLKITTGASYSELKRHGLKPLLEYTNPDLDTGSLDIELRRELGVNPEKALKLLDRYAEDGEVLTLIIGGKRYGSKWVITKNSKSYNRFDKKGRLLSADTSVTLQEYPDR